jgi:hypothetical protein
MGLRFGCVSEVEMDKDPVELSPLHRSDLSLAGFLLHNRWPDNLREWSQLLALAVRIAAVPGTVPSSEVFAGRDDTSGVDFSHVVGVVESAGRAIGPQAPAPGSLIAAPVLIVLHPPQETVPSTPDGEGCASGCLFLPGIPELGLDHRAAWVEADRDGNVNRLIGLTDVNPSSDPDLAVLATFRAA